VFEGTDAVMLSAETASGKYPVQAVETMDSILREVENYQWSRGSFGQLQKDICIYPIPNALARACYLLSSDVEIRAVNVLTRSGSTARIMSSSRPNAPIIGYCSDSKVANQMLLFWGVFPICIHKEMTSEEFIELTNKIVIEMGIASQGHHVLLVSGLLSGPQSAQTNSVVVYQVR
jgi:pyruvate kinase